MKFIKYIFLLVFLSEVALRVVGFGNPILYTNNTENYFPKFNQNLTRYKKSKVIIIGRIPARFVYEYHKNCIRIL